MTNSVHVEGYCPECGSDSLEVDLPGFDLVSSPVHCMAPGCPRPDAAHIILQDAQTEHVVTFTGDGFTLRHPVRERINDDLLRCPVHRWISDHDPGLSPGRYRVIVDGPGSWVTYEGMEPDHEHV